MKLILTSKPEGVDIHLLEIWSIGRSLDEINSSKEKDILVLLSVSLKSQE